ncbi:hypothetical protein ZEAMMB73_Zm00001d040307 [Zea mays]|uniref:Craniofacial development protein 2 n=1 Tax=Zea mays TaxID=4577 RepID=A0A1D6MPZ5_MAIZE|nr:hypothetical protein ZEAMMB73_Zm00001d040307 [Zea mays]
MVSSVPVGEKLFIGGDLNGHVGTSSTSFEGVHGGFGFGTRNQEGEEILNFALAYDMFIANTFFRKRKSHPVIFSSGQHTSQIDFVLLRKEDRHACLDCKVIPRECVVQKAIKEKKDCYKRLHHDKCANNIEKYMIVKKSAKRAVSRAQGQAYDDLYQWLDTTQGEKDIYRMAKIHERKTRDVNQVKCIKDEANQLLVKNEVIKNRWKEYFNKLFNGENESPTIELDEPFDDNNRGFCTKDTRI